MNVYTNIHGLEHLVTTSIPTKEHLAVCFYQQYRKSVPVSIYRSMYHRGRQAGQLIRITDRWSRVKGSTVLWTRHNRRPGKRAAVSEQAQMWPNTGAVTSARSIVARSREGSICISLLPNDNFDDIADLSRASIFQYSTSLFFFFLFFLILERR